MAIYHFKSQIIKRSAGRSATSAAAYRARTKIKDDRTGLTYDYGHIEKASYLKILAPDNVPEWVYDRAQLWNQVELAEKRKDSQVAREIMVALPSELSRSEKIKLGVKFIKDNYVSKGMVADLAFHDLNTKNPHLHVMLTTRTIDINGFGLKERSWNPSFKQKWASGDRLKEERQLWERYTNSALAESGHQSRVDCRSLKDKGSELIPQVHLGAAVNALEKRGIRTELGDEHRRIAKANLEITRLKLELEAKKLEAEREKKKQQQELEQLRKHSQKDPDKSQTTLDLEQIIRLLKGKSIGSKSESDLSGRGFGKNPNKSTTNSPQNRSKTVETKSDKPFNSKGFKQVDSRTQSIPDKTDNSPALHPKKSTNIQDNLAQKDNPIPQNRQSIASYFETLEKLRSKNTFQSKNTNQTPEQLEKSSRSDPRQNPSDQLTSPDNLKNAYRLLDLGKQIYNQTAATQAKLVQPNIWEVRGSNYILRFDSDREIFSISESNFGLLLEADLNKKFDSGLQIWSVISQFSIKAFEDYLKKLERYNEEKLKKRSPPQKSKDIEL